MPSSVNTIVNDPEFRTFSPDIQKQLIASADPSFKDLSTEDQNAFIQPYSNIAVSAQAISEPSPRDVFAQQYIKEQQAGPIRKAASSVGDIINAVKSIPSTLLKGGKGLSDTISQDVAALQNPQQATLGDNVKRAILGALVPGAGLLPNTTQSVLEGTERAFNLEPFIRQQIDKIAANPLATFPRMFLQPRTPTEDEISQAFVANQEAQNPATNGSQPILPEVIGKTNIPAAQGVALAEQLAPLVPGAVRIASSPIQIAKAVSGKIAPQIISNIAENRAPATLSQIAENALDFTPEQVAEHVPTAVGRVKQLIGNEVPKTAQEGVSALDKAENELYSQRQQINQAADVAGMVVNGNQAVEAAKSALDEIKTITQDEKSKILKKAEELYSGEKKPTEGQSVQEQLNAKLKGFYSAEDPVATAQQNVDLAIRNSYANQMDQINQAMTGRAETPYSDIGNIIETRNALSKKLDQIRMSEADKKGGIGRGPVKIPTSVYGAKAKTANTVLNSLQKNQLTKLNEATQRIFSEGSASIVSPEIPAATLEDLIKSKKSNQTSVESQISSLIKSYPKDIQKNPVLARKVAESELGIQ